MFLLTSLARSPLSGSNHAVHDLSQTSVVGASADGSAHGPVSAQTPALDVVGEHVSLALDLNDPSLLDHVPSFLQNLKKILAF